MAKYELNQVTVYPIQPEAPHERDWVYNNPITVAIISTLLFVTGSLILLWISAKYGGRDEDEDDDESVDYYEENIINTVPGTRGPSFVTIVEPSAMPTPVQGPSLRSSPRPSHILVQVPSARPSISQPSGRRMSRQRKKTVSMNPIFNFTTQRKSVPSKPEAYRPSLSGGRVRWSTAGYGTPGASFQVLPGENTAENPPPLFLLSVPVDGNEMDAQERKVSGQSHVFYAAELEHVGESHAHHKRSMRERRRRKGLAIPPVFMSNQRKCDFKRPKPTGDHLMSPKTRARRMRWSTVEVPIPSVNVEMVDEENLQGRRPRTFSEGRRSPNGLNVVNENQGKSD
ncbi:unnamed protein product [Orchesella dallaii]|uniref:Uncharacterized protein n=1 Tax=Orchesella dallaii TaxID=48710 RepID=A0ABP1PHL1_9HEXA